MLDAIFSWYSDSLSYIGDRMNMIANGIDTAMPMIFSTIPNQPGTLRILLRAIVVIATAHRFINKWLMPRLYWVIPPINSQSASHTINTVPIANAVNPEMFSNLSMSLCLLLNLRIKCISDEDISHSVSRIIGANATNAP